ncbi:mannosyltransferase [Neofusicoccum ribis]|uniref:Mannosyltransferase n=1 Tax=Neofusicoccum ribis TaxID=45134 RepID=A0ABR3SCQ2_9PEZI
MRVLRNGTLIRGTWSIENRMALDQPWIRPSIFMSLGKLPRQFHSGFSSAGGDGVLFEQCLIELYSGNDILGHYDVRYFGGVVTDDERKTTIRHMTRAYLTWFRKQGLETWIAHGTLLGWWWSGRMLPWDWDVDTQVADRTLAFLAHNHNRTRVHYRSADGSGVERTYLLDVNPHSEERVRGDGMNIIDARWIDTSNGLYIDITGLSETDREGNPGVWSCKNNHNYHTSDLYPMRESSYEGVPALIPYAYDKILVEEYQEKALTATEYEG